MTRLDEIIVDSLRVDRWQSTVELYDSVKLRIRATYSAMWQRLRVLEAARRIERGGLVSRRFEWRLLVG